jgi:hypothetical protein
LAERRTKTSTFARRVREKENETPNMKRRMKSMKSMKEHEEEDETPNTCAPNAATAKNGQRRRRGA